MTRAELQEAVASLEYLIRNRFDPAKIENYAAQLQAFREELRALEEKETLAAAAPLRFLFQHTVTRLMPKRPRATRT